jgi:hypothetical protein
MLADVPHLPQDRRMSGNGSGDIRFVWEQKICSNFTPANTGDEFAVGFVESYERLDNGPRSAAQILSFDRRL